VGGILGLYLTWLEAFHLHPPDRPINRAHTLIHTHTHTHTHTMHDGTASTSTTRLIELDSVGELHRSPVGKGCSGSRQLGRPGHRAPTRMRRATAPKWYLHCMLLHSTRWRGRWITNCERRKVYLFVVTCVGRLYVSFI